MKKLCFFIILISLTQIAVHGQSAPVDAPSDVSTEGWNVFSQDKYEIKFPIDWAIDTSGVMGSKFFLFNKLALQSEGFMENINLIVQDLSAYDLDLNQYVEISEKQITTVLTDGVILSSERKSREGIEYQQVKFSGRQGIFNLAFEQHYFIVDKNAFVLTFTCKTEDFDAVIEISKQVMDGFKIKTGN